MGCTIVRRFTLSKETEIRLTLSDCISPKNRQKDTVGLWHYAYGPFCIQVRHIDDSENDGNESTVGPDVLYISTLIPSSFLECQG